jgi:hypothetical protein
MGRSLTQPWPPRHRRRGARRPPSPSGRRLRPWAVCRARVPGLRAGNVLGVSAATGSRARTRSRDAGRKPGSLRRHRTEAAVSSNHRSLPPHGVEDASRRERLRAWPPRPSAHRPGRRSRRSGRGPRHRFGGCAGVISAPGGMVASITAMTPPVCSAPTRTTTSKLPPSWWPRPGRGERTSFLIEYQGRSSQNRGGGHSRVHEL